MIHGILNVYKEKGYTSHDVVAKLRGIVRQKVVFSPEEPLTPLTAEAPPPGRRSVPVSTPWLPAAAGLLLGSVVVRDILNQKEREPIC